MTRLERWSVVSLPGTGHVIPPVCPNCLAPGTVPVRYQRVGMQVFLSLLLPLSFFPFERRDLQTFHYCKACAEEARAATRRGRVLDVFSSFPVQLLLVLAPIVPLWWLPEVRMLLLGLLLIPALEIPMMIYLGRWIAKASLRRAMRLHPQRTGQAVWGHAVYYVAPYPLMNGTAVTTPPGRSGSARSSRRTPAASRTRRTGSGRAGSVRASPDGARREAGRGARRTDPRPELYQGMSRW